MLQELPAQGLPIIQAISEGSITFTYLISYIVNHNINVAYCLDRIFYS